MNMKYNSLHEYLDDVFKDKQPSRNEIKKAKREYWKIWYRFYRREERKRKREFSLRLHPDEIEQMDRIKGDLGYSQFLYKAVRKSLLSKEEPRTDPQEFAKIKQLLMQVINLLEEHIENDKSELTSEILSEMEKLEEDFRLFCIKVEL